MADFAQRPLAAPAFPHRDCKLPPRERRGGGEIKKRRKAYKGPALWWASIAFLFLLARGLWSAGLCFNVAASFVSLGYLLGWLAREIFLFESARCLFIYFFSHRYLLLVEAISVRLLALRLVYNRYGFDLSTILRLFVPYLLNFYSLLLLLVALICMWSISLFIHFILSKGSNHDNCSKWTVELALKKLLLRHVITKCIKN